MEKPALAVLYEEGDTEDKTIGSDVGHHHLRGGNIEGLETGGEIGGGRGGGLGGGVAAGRDERGGAAVEGPKERQTAGAYVLMRGAVDLYVFER